MLVCGTRGNSLAQKLTDITERDRVDVILTNAPFGGGMAGPFRLFGQP